MEKNLKNVYKRSLAMDLVQMGHDLHHSIGNLENPKYQVFCFEHTKELDRDIALLTGHDYEAKKQDE
ncbi:hypothetical protein [Bacillus safensis]|uniref:hypothetical protein n=1 Tax=Bacillus safensis TaxID=561879 RepID=UPI001CD6A8DF|nr:hypothetical protein [Bacillus safensis]